MKGADIEKELFRLCKDCHHAKYKHFSDNLRLLFIQFRVSPLFFVMQNVQNFASKVNTGVISVVKLCSIEPDELADFCRNNNVSLHDNEEIGKLFPHRVTIKMFRLYCSDETSQTARCDSRNPCSQSRDLETHYCSTSGQDGTHSEETQAGSLCTGCSFWRWERGYDQPAQFALLWCKLFDLRRKGQSEGG